MKAELVVYKILSFLLLPVAAFFGIICLFSLITALANPPMLISVFLNACMVIYIIASFIFFTKGVEHRQACKPVLRDWIKINGIITLLFYLLVTFVFISIQFNPSLLNDALKQMESQNSIPAGITHDELANITRSFISFFLVLSILLIIHIFITFHLMQLFRGVFEPERIDTEE